MQLDSLMSTSMTLSNDLFPSHSLMLVEIHMNPTILRIGPTKL